MKVLKPTNNKQTGTPKSHGYNAYDHDDVPDTNYKSSIFGKVVQSKNSETRNWLANTESDPYKVLDSKGKIKPRALLTADYGNYIKIKGTVDGKTIYQLGSHFKQGSVLPVGTEVSAGQTVAQMGSTGNSTGAHGHTEYRDEKEVKLVVEFVDQTEPIIPKPMENNKEQIIIDAYKAITGEYPNNDEKKARLQKNENTVDLINDLLKNDSRSKVKWLEAWNAEDNDVAMERTIEEYKNTLYSLKEILGVTIGSSNEELVGKAQGLMVKLKEAIDASQIKVVYKYQDKDYVKVLSFGGLVIITERA